jgi:glucokinase
MRELELLGLDSLLFEEAEKEGKISARTAFNAAKRGDAYGQKLVDDYVTYLAAGITNAINIFQPEVVSIGGGVSGEGENLLAPLRKIVDIEQYTRDNPVKAKLVKAVLGNDAGIVGAAGLGKHTLA